MKVVLLPVQKYDHLHLKLNYLERVIFVFIIIKYNTNIDPTGRVKIPNA